MTQKKKPLNPVQTSAEFINSTTPPQLPQTNFNQIIDDDKYFLQYHPLMNSIPFGGSFGYFESDDDKW